MIDLIPKYYDTRRVLTILREDDSEERVEIDPTLQTPHAQKQGPDGKVRRLFNPKLGDYEVAVTIGPSFATKRAEAADSMLAFMKAVPQSGPLIGDLIAKNMDWPGAEEIATRLAATLPPGLLGKNINDFPPEAKAMIQQMQQQLEKLGGEHKQALALLGDKDKDRAIQTDKINKDYEAKLLKIVADMEKTALQVAQSVKDLEGKLDQSERKMTSDRENSDREFGRSMLELYRGDKGGGESRASK